MNNRFTYSHSSMHGWCVYDRERGSIPAYEACNELLPLRTDPGDGTTYAESPVRLASGYHATRLCHKLNNAYERAMKEAL